ncbi:MAG: TRAP transporter large permease [Firmicutes bacterium]|nr:TRAP transporter large permease [Bacillota bacterium]
MITVLLAILFTLLVGRVPIFICLAFAPLAVLILFSDISPIVAAQCVFGGIDKFALMAMPFFIFAADLMRHGGIAKRLVNFTNALAGFMRGGLALTTQLGCMFFGALSGSSPATVAAIGGMMYPELVEKGYNKGFAIGLITVSGAVAILIPPSITMIVYGSVTGVSVGALFIGGFGAGVLFGGAVLLYSYYHAVKTRRLPDSEFSLGEILRTGKEALWSLGVPIIILGGIYTGVFTPTEAAGVSAVYAILVGMFVYKELTLKKLYEVTLQSATTCASVMVLVAGATVFGWVLTVYEVPQQLAGVLLGPGTSKALFWIAVNILFLIAGMFMDGSAAVTILAPLVYPLAMKLGINPVHLGIVLTANLAVGMYTPPFGLNLFVATGVTKEPMTKIVPTLGAFLAVTLVALMVITYWPAASLYLPGLVYPDILH